MKSLMIIFNQNNYSDLSVFFFISLEGLQIIEITGERFLCNNILELLNDDPEFYKNRGAEAVPLNARLEAIDAELLTAYARWEELEALR